MGFETDILKSVYSKTYPHCKKTLSVDVDNEKINYDKIGIELGDTTTSNFSQDENFVVLEYVNRLLEKEYEPEHLMLERRWQVGLGASGGKADINVFNRDDKTLFIIECKCWGKQYERYKQKMQNDGSQLFGYLQQDKNTQFICLYSSRLENNKIEYANSIIPIKDREETLRLLEEGEEVKTYREAKTKEEHYEVWKENFNCYFAPNGIFDDEVLAYNPELIPIKRKDLKGFSEDEGRKFYYQFLEILRHNNISDKSNAFNRIMSLILCKIVDERKDENEITDFQIIEGKDTPESIQERLQSLYAKGMRDFLREEIVNYTEKDIDDIVSRFPRQKAQKEIKVILRALKFYSNNEFAFKEVHNEKLFLENAKVLNEILTLLQYKKFRYSYNDNNDAKFQKQYLGNFFELLLDSGYKQDEGQYFTPIPIAKFIVWSLPIKEIIEKKLKDKKAKFLPYVMDYACGSGHFLTEVIEEIQHVANEIKPEYDKATNKEIEFIKSNTLWTEEFIYGIEKDYRLARTSKVACFMHGDGEATIIFGDGLEDYNEKGKSLAPGYDIIVANPPYSVHGFKPHIQKLGDKYSLYQYLTDTSSEIEALFVERTAQLLNKDGIAGIILPNSILNSNSTIYTKTRELILQNFEIKAIVECGSDTFLATETQTVILFLQRRDDRWKEDYRYVAEDFILHNKKRDDDFADTQSLFKAYIENLELEFEAYKTLVAKRPSDKLKETEWFKDYQKWFDKLTEIINLKKSNAFKQLKLEDKKEKLEKLLYDKVLHLEKEKFYYFLLAYGQQTLVVKTGTDKEEQRNFLGYEKKKGKRDAGLKMYLEEDTNQHITCLYDENDRTNEGKANTIIYNSLINKTSEFPANLLQHFGYINLNDCIDWTRIDFDGQIRLSSERKYKPITSKYPQKYLDEICEIVSGGTPARNNNSYWKGNIKWLTIQEFRDFDEVSETKETITEEGLKNSSAKLLPKGSVLVTIFATIGRVAILGAEMTTNQAIVGLLPLKDIIGKFLMYMIHQNKWYLLAQGAGAAQNNINTTILKRIKIPVPPMKVQEIIISDIEKIEGKEKKWQQEILDFKTSFRDLLQSVYDSDTSKVELSKICSNVQYGISQQMNTINKGYKIFRMNEIVNSRMYDGGSMKCVDIEEEEFLKYKLNKGDILFNRTNSFELVGKTGIFELVDGEYCFASYLIRLVVDNTKANPWFVNLMMNSDYYQQEAKSLATKSINQSNINAQKMQSIKIPLPDLTTQNEIAKKAIDLEAKISKLVEKLAKIPEGKENILRKYL